MQAVHAILILLAVSAILRLVARKIKVPDPVLLVLGGLVLAFVPRMPQLNISPDVLFLLFVPPLLYWGSLTSSLRDFRRESAAIARYSTVVVLLTMSVVAVIFHWLTPEFTWAAAFLLGAIVSAPDPVAAIAVLSSTGAPRTVVSILEGEGLLNDATALVCYQIAVAAVVTGIFSPWHAVFRFLGTGAGGAALGLAISWFLALVRRELVGRYPVVENTISLLTPFLAYLAADTLTLSGVIAVVAAGFYLGRKGPRMVAPATRIQSESLWAVVQFLLESLVFIFVGLELRSITGALHSYSNRTLVAYGLILVGSLILVRLVYAFTAVTVLRRWRRAGQSTPSWKLALVIGWTGMRGGDSLVIALALPLATVTGARFPERDLIIFLTFVTILTTLVLQGFTLGPLLRLLHLHSDGEEEMEEAAARHAVALAGLNRLDEIQQRGSPDPSVVAEIRRKIEIQVKRWAAREMSGANFKIESNLERRARSYRELRSEVIKSEMEKIIALRDENAISDDVMRRVQHDLDLEWVLLGPSTRETE